MNDYHARIIADLRAGNTVRVRGKGNSMTPKIRSGEVLTFEPILDPSTVQRGDIVFCKVNGNVYDGHLVTGIRTRKGVLEFQISNNHGHVNGWTRNVWGRCIKIGD